MLEPSRPAGRRQGLAVLAAAGILSLAVLILTVTTQIFDSNLFAMTGAQSLLAGDWPYRDFFETGIPLATFMAAAGQLLTGHRLIGEFVRQWAFIVAGVVIAFHLGLRLSRSPAATSLMVPVALFVLARTPTYHYSKLFFFPLTIWLGWRYIEQPTRGRAAMLGLCAAAGFLERHDYGIYLGFASVTAWVIARAATPASRTGLSLVGDAATYAAVVLAVTAPWLVAVERYEGLIPYTRARAALFQGSPPVYSTFFRLSTLTDLIATPPPPPVTPGIVRFKWRPYVTPAERERFEREQHLTIVPGEDNRGRLQYQVPDIYDTVLLKLDPYVTDGAGFDWDRVTNSRWYPPSPQRIALWLQRMALLLPLALGVSGAISLVRDGWRGGGSAPGGWQKIYAAVFLAAVDATLFREATYVVVVAPVSAALTSAFLASRVRVTRLLSAGLVAVTTFMAAMWLRGSVITTPGEYPHLLAAGWQQLTASPPAYDSVEFDYVRACTRPTDHVLVLGDNPLHVSYFSQRPIAGGHVSWHYGWLADPDHERASLRLLQRQEVPVVLSIRDPVMADLARYPAISAYVRERYREVEGTGGRVLVDTRRPVTGRFPATGYPCFS